MDNESSKAGPTIGIIIIIVVLLAGALYFFSQTANKQTAETNSDTILEQGAADIESLKTQSNSDSLTSITQDLNDTNLTTLDKEAAAIDTEITNLK